nr:transmembrane protein 94 isoform X3 [Ciona intestinalis]|eukprot:XP_026695224.1 transmembrane protein 94 isoform X3 [Ciona intestinalis]
MIKIAQELEEVAAKYSHDPCATILGISSTLPWPVLACGVICVAVLFGSVAKGFAASSTAVVCILILLLLALNIFVHVWSERKQRKEIIQNLLWLSKLIKETLEESSFLEILDDFLTFLDDQKTSYLNTSSQTYLYNQQYDKPVLFPTSLIATDDIIGLCVGQSSPCAVACNRDTCIRLSKGDSVNQDDLKCNNSTEDSYLHQFKVLKSPIIEEITGCLETKGIMHDRPRSTLTIYRRIVMRNVVMMMLPMLTVVSVGIGCLWLILGPMVDIEGYVLLTDQIHWFSVAAVSPCLIVLPVLPIMCPVIWSTLLGVGEAKTISPTMKSNHSMKYKFLKNWQRVFLDILVGRNLSYSGAFEMLGTLTVLCCVNKEGILSWYEPAPEKIFFLNKHDVDTDSTSDSDDEPDTLAMNATFEGSQAEPHIEILTLSQDTQNSNKLHFDDLDWGKHLSSLKPIGLNITVSQMGNPLDPAVIPAALNKTEQRFYSDVIMKHNECDTNVDLLEAEKRMEFVAVSNGLKVPETLNAKLGLCSLSRLIGFSEDIRFLYLPKRTMSIFRTTNPPHDGDRATRPNKHQESESLMFAHGMVVSHAQYGNHLLTSGTGDLILELSDYFWNGEEVQKFTETSRKKCLDFHHRSAIMGHCVGFSYKPVSSQFAELGNSFQDISNEHSVDQFPSKQIFLGMLSVQYQARLHIFQFVEALEGACIRFVHFSSADEFKSRVFAEKMGLEVGWNCHISLSSNNLPRDSMFETLQNNPEYREECSSSEDELSALIRDPQMRSESSISDSEFHALNRAKLPRGVENIVPHIENVDNVPLLVPLFTDCKHQSSRRMIEIMQKYGEVVCCVGSSDSIKNIIIFSQANVSIGLQPIVSCVTMDDCDKLESLNSSRKSESKLYFQPSSTTDNFTNLDNSNTLDDLDNIAMTTARKLNTFPCSVALSGDSSLLVIYNMIRKARHFLFLLNVSLIFYMKCLSMISLVQLLGHVIYFPPIFTAVDVFWLVFILTPILSFSLLGSPPDSDLMTWASLKNTTDKIPNIQIFRQNLVHFSTKFLPSCLVVVILHVLCVLSICYDIDNKLAMHFNISSNVTNQSTINKSMNPPYTVKCPPVISVLVENNTNIAGFRFRTVVQQKTRESQQIAVFILFLYMCIISSTYIQRWKSLKQVSPLSNKPWIICVLTLLVVQTLYSYIVVTSGVSTSKFTNPIFYFGPYQNVIFPLATLWSIPCLVSNELAKWREIQLWTRSQKRARLEFGTKLGMNSPF